MLSPSLRKDVCIFLLTTVLYSYCPFSRKCFLYRSTTQFRGYMQRFFCVLFGVLLQHRNDTNLAQVHHVTV